VSGNAPQGGNFTDVQRGILGILREHQNTQEGVPVQHVVNSLNRTFDDKDILAALDFLMGEGHIYTGIDDMHVKASQLD
jgi:replication factor A2